MTDQSPEPMDAFFTARLDGYEEHMLSFLNMDFYRKIADLIPAGSRTLLDLGCGTGLELDEVFRRLPDIAVTGIDMTRSMLDVLAEKHADRQITLICGDYCQTGFGDEPYDCVISAETIHHLERSEKTGLYRKIKAALKPEGLYIEFDFYAVDQAMEDEYHEHAQQLRIENNLNDESLYHLDIPYTVGHQAEMLLEAGFTRVETIMMIDNNGILTARQ